MKAWDLIYKKWYDINDNDIRFSGPDEDGICLCSSCQKQKKVEADLKKASHLTHLVPDELFEL